VSVPLAKCDERTLTHHSIYSTTNHLERLDPALSRPGRMDVWVEFKNASKWQAEALFRNFFPSMDDESDIILEGDLDGVDLPNPPASPPQSPTSEPGSSTLWSLSSSFSSSTTSLTSPSTAAPKAPPLLPQFGENNQAYLPPPVEEHIASSQHSAKPLDGVTLGILAKKFADSIPEEEFSVAALQGCEFGFLRCVFVGGIFMGFVTISVPVWAVIVFCPGMIGLWVRSRDAD